VLSAAVIEQAIDTEIRGWLDALGLPRTEIEAARKLL
jgi:hypothetical protein